MGAPVPHSDRPGFGPLTLVPPPAAHTDRPLPAARPGLRAAIILAPFALLIVIAYLVVDLWSQMPPIVQPRHRAEAVCFSLARPDPVTRAPFAPPMRIEPSAALVPGRFAPGTRAGVALRQQMRLDESMVLDESERSVGDYAVSVLWLSLPRGAGGAPGEASTAATDAGHWLVLAWMEGSDLAVCNFRFTGDAEHPTREWSPVERAWGERLLARTLIAENFREGSLPRTGLRMTRGTVMPAFGPAASR